MFRKKVKGVALLLLGLAVFNVSGCQTQQVESNNSSVNITFDKVDITLEVGKTTSITPKILGDASLADFDINVSSEAISIEVSGNVLVIKADSVGQSILTLTYKNDATIKESILISVVGDEEFSGYKLEIDTSECKTKYLLHDSLDFNALKVYAYEYKNGVKDENSKILVTSYKISVEGGESLNELGKKVVNIATDLFGSTSFEIEVVDELVESYLTVDTSKVAKVFNKGATFSSSGLIVNENQTITSLDDNGERVSSSKVVEVSDYSLNYKPAQLLNDCGVFEVNVTKENVKGTSYKIYVQREDDEFNSLASTFINTKDVALEVNSTIPDANSYFGSHYIMNFKPNYFVKTDYKKTSRDDVSTLDVSSETALFIDKNKNLVSADIENNALVAKNLVKQKASNYWDYLPYCDITSFKDYPVNLFPKVSYANDSGYFVEEVTPIQGQDNYATSLASYPFVVTTFNIANIDVNYFKYVTKYEILHDDKTLEIKVYVDGYGVVSVKALEKGTNLDNELVKSAIGKEEFSFNTTIDSSLKDFKDALLLNNYSIGSSYGRGYYTEKYFYQYYEPIAIIAGLYSQGFVACKDENNELSGAGIYQFTGTDGGDNVVSAINTESVALVVGDTSSISYSDLFIDIADVYLSTEFKDIIDDDTILATFEPVEGTYLYLSKNADASEAYLDHFAGSEKDTLIQNGYIYPAFQLNYVGGDIDSITLYLLNDSLYGYSQLIEDIGQVEIKAIEEYFNL